MSLQVRQGPPAKVSDLIQAQERELALEQELPAVRTSATAWRNGLGALLAAVVGFGLIKGRSDISQVASPWNTVAGSLLFVSLACGAVAALLLLRAAHGVPAMRKLRSAEPGPAWAHSEAVASVRALRRGVRYFFGCVACLVVAVAVTWYGPAAVKPQLSVTVGDTSTCGAIVGLANDVLTIKTSTGQTTVNLGKATAIRIVDSCETSASQ
ncbi:hypothetical protein J7E93_08295 [Streptomyces sp. ISL-36]|uniref:hypothetical protein n=1 Tax=Streptomyces sp. ISL-36 TaxID=2819182 RepID=UPI001BE6A290|nr:hypothetical protein [Streptomyces sp. ISL-36]MBT2440115.1 hypothetical protein [Streptomyces sp. ISL-36]